ncbi:hypothetical protein [Sporisorium scitamineum]|uniref:Homeobox domain-containing protein n=1 Tax=Sporisorium scitamineum TaxID=49012 RepID=A0A0F7S5S6_9BASI|nr:hypothetical protein [Sporisorium scitamineum]
MASSTSAAGPAGAASASAPSSSSSTGSLLSYWDHGATSDSDLMASVMTPSDPHHGIAEFASGGGHHRYASTASLPAFPSSSVAGGHASSSHSYMTASADHYHPYRAASMSMAGPTQHSYHSAHQQSVMSSGATYLSVSGQMAASPGFVYGPSAGSSAPLGPGSDYDTYPPVGAPPPSSYSQYVSYLPPAMSHDSRFYPLNPFEIKHRRRTTKTQFRVLESTFREVPKPNATLRKQISAQLDMPVRAVQIWFQNRRAKAKAMEKKKQTGTAVGSGGNTGGGGGGSAEGAVGFGPEDNYALSSSSTLASVGPTLPSIDSGLLLDRRQLPPPSLSGTMPMLSAMSTGTGLGSLQDQRIDRSSAEGASHPHHAATSILTAATAMPSVSDRSTCMSNLSTPYATREPPPPLPSTTSRSYDTTPADQHPSNRFWPTSQ